MRLVGQPVRPVDWDAKTSGQQRYAGDRLPEGTLVGRILRSPHPHARIERLDVTRAHDLEGVVAVVTAADLPSGVRYLHSGGNHRDRPPLADGVVRYVGEEVAAVAAETAELAEAALAAIEVSYRRLRAPLTIDEALAPQAPALHRRPTDERNVSVHDVNSWGDAERARRASVVSVDGTFWYPRVSHACMEPNTTLAWWHPERQVMELWTATQAPWFVVQEVANALGLQPHQVVCRDVATGGGFGSKSKVSEHEVVAAALSRAARGRPVLVALSREEEFGATKPRHAFRVGLRAHADDHGRICLFETRIDADNGAYNHYGPSILKVGVKTTGSIYQPDAVTWDARLVDTALPPGGQFRGYGSPQVAFAIESLVDELAERQGVDPVDYRIANANLPGTTCLSGARLGSARMVECLQAVREAINWDEKRHTRQPGRGVGVAAGMHGSGSYAFDDANRSEVDIDLLDDGRVEVRFGGADAGTGQRTVLAQIAAEEIGVDLDSVNVVMGDTELAPFDLGAWSSRGTHMGGHAVRKGARELAAMIRQLAAGKLDASPADVVLADGRARSPSGDVGFADLVALSPEAVGGRVRHRSTYVDELMERFGDGNPSPNYAASYTFAAHAVEVEVDSGTGEIHVVDYVAAHDIGRAVNPNLAKGQIIGGVVQGLGAVLGEELIYEGGRTVNPAYINYALPRAADVCRVRPILVEGEEEAGPYDAKSVGEMPIVPPAPAVANAIYDAVGVRLRELPFTPDKVLAELAERNGRARRQHHLWHRPDRWQIELLRRAYPYGVKRLLHRVGTRFARRVPPAPIDAVEHPTSLPGLAAGLATGPTRDRAHDSAVLGGGTDLLLQRRQRLLSPRLLLAIRDVSDVQTMEVGEDRGIEIGAGVTLDRLEAADPNFPVVIAEAVRTIASAQIRAVATVGGNLVQAKRCWFFRNGFDCYKRGGWTCPCYAVDGDHRFYHAAMHAHRCQAVTPSDLATALAALDADVVLASVGHERVVPINNFYRGPGETVLGAGEFVRSVRVGPTGGARVGTFQKLRLWEGDFAVLSVAMTGSIDGDGRWRDARVVFGALAPTPWRASDAEAALEGQRLGGSTIDAACSTLDRQLDHEGHPLPGNRWKLDAAVGLLRRALAQLARR